MQGAAREEEAKKLGIEVTDKDVDARVASITKQYFAGDKKKYAAELKKEGLTDAEARNLVKALLISEQLTTKVTSDLKISDADVHKYFVANKAQYPPTRDVQYILLGKDKEALAQKVYNELKGGADFAAMAKKYSQDSDHEEHRRQAAREEGPGGAVVRQRRVRAQDR